MGMYDYLRCERPLEDGRVLEGKSWQTKDGPCEMGLLVITNDGRLMVEEAHTETIPEEERPYYGKPEWKEGSIVKFCGSIRRVIDRVVDANYHGEVMFRSSTEEYSAIFVNGTCIHLSEVIDARP